MYKIAVKFSVWQLYFNVPRIKTYVKHVSVDLNLLYVHKTYKKLSYRRETARQLQRQGEGD